MGFTTSHAQGLGGGRDAARGGALLYKRGGGRRVTYLAYGIPGIALDPCRCLSQSGSPGYQPLTQKAAIPIRPRYRSLIVSPYGIPGDKPLTLAL